MNKKNTNRVTKNSYDKSKKRVTIRFSPGDFKKIESKSKDYGYKNTTEFIRECAIKSGKYISPKIQPDINWVKFSNETRRIGVNHNQLTKKINSLKGSFDSSTINESLIEIRESLNALKNKLNSHDPRNC